MQKHRYAFDELFDTTVLVMGMHMEDDKTSTMVPKRCFVEHQSDTLGRKKTVAVPVSGYELWQAQPMPSILDLDPECSWIGGKASRFHDA